MFPFSGLLKNVSCPEAHRCRLLYCCFSHPAPVLQDVVSGNAISQESAYESIPRVRPAEEALLNEPAILDSKKRRLDGDIGPRRITAHGDKAESSKAPVAEAGRNLHTLDRSVSPPTANCIEGEIPPPAKAGPVPVKAKTQPLQLLPRTVPTTPAQYSRRKLYIDRMNHEFQQGNAMVSDSKHADRLAMLLSKDEIVDHCVSYEAKIAIENPHLYEIQMQKRIASLKKWSSKLAHWVDFVKKEFAAHWSARIPAARATTKAATKIVSLAADLQHRVLGHLLVDQSIVKKYGYVIAPPSPQETENARAHSLRDHNFQKCARCGLRYQAFRDRQSDGLLTTNGSCTYHWARAARTRQSHAESAMHGPRSMTYACCGRDVHAEGCSTADTHVYKVEDPAMMAATLPFIDTPLNTDQARGPSGNVPRAVTFDCEMGYTSYGLELLRLTAISWPEAEPLVDVLVRSQGVILDLNTRFSGVTPEMYADAKPCDPAAAVTDVNADPASAALTIVEDTGMARAMLCSFLTPETPLIGHSIENDLNAVRLCHPRLADTVILFPHARGLPYRLSLKQLCKDKLNREIQNQGAQGHDSFEDAQATGDLVKIKVIEHWDVLQRKGWQYKDGQLLRGDG